MRSVHIGNDGDVVPGARKLVGDRQPDHAGSDHRDLRRLRRGEKGTGVDHVASLVRCPLSRANVNHCDRTSLQLPAGIPSYAPAMAVSQTRRARAQRRRVKRVAAADNDLTPVQWQSIKDAWGGCAYCGVTDLPLQRDCVLPISRGGRYTVENIVPACRSCNASKSNDEVTSWMRRRRFDEPAFLQRWVEIGRALRDAAKSAPAT